MNISGFKAMAESLKLYHRITDDKYQEIGEKRTEIDLEKMYVDILPNNGILNMLLERNTTFLVGQRGTGKSTIFGMAQKEISRKKKDLSIYINAKNIYKSCEIDSTNITLTSDSLFTENELFRISFIKKAISELCNSLTKELSTEKNGFIGNLRNYSRDSQLERLIDDISHSLETEEFQMIDKIISKNESIDNKEVVAGKLKASLAEAAGEVSGSIENGKTERQNRTIAKVFNISNLINKFLSSIDICKRNGMYIFIDDYSELSYAERSIFMNELIAPFYHMGIDKVFIKIACYPNKIDPLNLDTQKYTILNIDYFEIYGVDNNITDTENKAVEYIERLLSNASNVCCEESISDFFDTTTYTMDEYYRVLQRISMNTPRILGHILNTCYIKRIVNEKTLNMSVLQEASVKYYKEHVIQEFENRILSSDVDRDTKVNIFVQKKIISAIEMAAKKNKVELPKTSNKYFNQHREVPTSHFRINVEYDMYFEDLSFYGFVQKVNEIADKGKVISGKNINTSIYALNYGLCYNEKILYGKPNEVDTKYYQQRSFLYDDYLLGVLHENKKIVCKDCGTEYPIDMLEAFSMFKMKCQRCENGKCEIRYDCNLIKNVDETYHNAIWQEFEIQIVYCIYELMQERETEWFMASDIAPEIDATSQIIAARCRKLANAAYVLRDEKCRPYKYKLSERSINIIEDNKK